MTNEDNTFVLPTNVKQIGTISDSTSRIYMEDYVQTYIEQYAKADITKERIAILIGKKIQAEGDEVLFISGVVQGKYTIKKNNMLELTDKSWQYVRKQIIQYFNGLDIVGWVYVQPGFEDYIGENVCNFQKINQDKGLELLYITDPSENINSFYHWNKENEMFNQIKGYIIYYEKNEGMHEYMLENKIKQPKNEDNPPKIKQDAGAIARKVATNKKRHYRLGRKGFSDSKKLINTLGGLSFIMLMVCFVMGAGLIQNDERINKLEEKISFLESEIKESQAVFANQVFEDTTVATTYLQQTTTAQTTTQPTTTQQNSVAINTQSAQPTYNKYVVQNGDTLIKICKSKYGNATNLEKIKEINNLNGNTIVVGDTLLLP